MARTEFELDQYKKGNLIAWNISTQCWNSVKVQIYAGSKVYFEGSKPFKPSGNMEVIGLDNSVLETDDVLKISVEVPESSEIQSSIVSGAISDKRARRVGYIYDICLEDQGDRDFNDVYINIVGWKNQATDTSFRG